MQESETTEKGGPSAPQGSQEPGQHSPSKKPLKLSSKFSSLFGQALVKKCNLFTCIDENNT